MSFLNAFDRWRERYGYEWLDNTRAKSWFVHGVITVVVGHIIAVLPWIDRQMGMRLVVCFYLVRETWNIVAEGNRDYLDATMDVLTPLAFSELVGLIG